LRVRGVVEIHQNVVNLIAHRISPVTLHVDGGLQSRNFR
jgi:hypothetical protein